MPGAGDALSAGEVEHYQFQLEQVRQALEADPENAEMRKLEADLQEVIDLSLSLASATAAAVSVQNAGSRAAAEDAAQAAAGVATVYKIGDVVAAKWSGSGKLYEATIAALPARSSATNNNDLQYSVVFKGYTKPEVVRMSDIRLFDAAIVQSAPKRKSTTASSNSKNATLNSSNKRSTSTASKNAFALKKEKHVSRQAEIDAQHLQQQHSWLNFASGSGSKKRKTVALAPGGNILKKKSMFATPDNAAGRVGVVGSGKGMTDYGGREKHLFDLVKQISGDDSS